MKNFYLWIVAVMVCIGILPAAAQDVQNVTFTVNIANAEGIKCWLNSDEIPLHDGANILEFPDGTYLNFTATLPWKITGVTDKNNTAASGFYGTDWYLYVTSEIADQEFTINVINIDESRTSQFTINVDDASLVNAVLSGYNQIIALKNGENTVKYDPDMELYLQLSPVSYEVPFYSVKKNGVKLAPLGGSYYSVELEDDCMIEITAILPDEDHTVTFAYSEGAENSISVLLNNEEVPDFNGKELVVKLGDRLQIEGSKDYKYESVKVNGQEVSFYGSYTLIVMEDTEVYIDAHPYGNVSASIVVNLPEYITITRNGNLLDLVAGENIIEFPENEANIMWDIKGDVAILNSVTVNGGEPLSPYSNYYTLSDGDVVVFDIAEKVFDKEAIIWVDNAEASICSYIEFSSLTDHSTRFNLQSGYTLVSFYEAMNPFSFSWYGSGMNEEGVFKGAAYLNGELLQSAYENSTSYIQTINDGDVLKLFMNAAPVDCKVSFDMAEGVEASVVKDIITAVENPAQGFDCFAGTEVTVSGEGLEVKVNGIAVEGRENEEGATAFTFIIENAETSVAIAKAGGSGVDTVASECDSTVFNMQGVKVGSSLKGLAPGIYIVAGKKVIVAD